MEREEVTENNIIQSMMVAGTVREREAADEGPSQDW